MESDNKAWVVCPVCSAFKPKGKHTFDNTTCLLGRRQWYTTLSNEDQMVQLRKYEIINTNLADHVWELSVNRGVSPVQVMQDESLWLLV
jgi:hypothetical protein